MEVQVRRAVTRDLRAVKKLADKYRHELGFLRFPTLQEAIKARRIFVASVNSSRVIGFVHFRCCKDGHTTIYEIAVEQNFCGKGIGKALLQAVVEEAKKRGCSILRLKCPIDLPANGFYHRFGFHRVGIESGKNRPLAVWQLDLNTASYVPCPVSPSWQFFVGLTSDASQIRALVRRFFEGYNFKPPFNPFERVIISPLFVEPSTLRLLKSWRLGEATPTANVPCLVSLMFDSGGYQVQMGKLTYDELCRRLRELYERETWADFYVLPDHVPKSRDTDKEVELKIKETLTMGELFLKWLDLQGSMRQGIKNAGKAIGVVHGRTVEQVVFAARKWHKLGVDYVAFGSFGTSGPKGSVNMLSQRALKLLKALTEETAANGQKLHIFGIGNPTYLLRLSENGIKPTSFDSTGWWKAGGFGKVFLASSQQFHITRSSSAYSRFKNTKDSVGHNCPFCVDVFSLKQSRWRRILHNLVSFEEAVQSLNSKFD